MPFLEHEHPEEVKFSGSEKSEKNIFFFYAFSLHASLITIFRHYIDYHDVIELSCFQRDSDCFTGRPGSLIS